MAPIRAPTTAHISGSVKVPSTKPALVKTLSRLSRLSLINLALQWLETENNPALYPYLETNRNLEEETEEDYLYEVAKDIESLRETYETLKHEKGNKRDVIDRILDGDWRRGISLQQLAMIDFQHLQENDTSLRWSALKLVVLKTEEDTLTSKPGPKKRRKLDFHTTEPPFPQIQPATFISTLSSEISSLVKAHYHLHTLPAPYSLPILRLHVSDSPYCRPTPASESHFLESARTLYIALPDSCPYIYVALSGPGPTSADARPATKMDINSLKRTVLEAVPKALSRPQERYALEPTDLTVKSLRAICQLRGNGKGGASGGAFTIFSDGGVDASPLDVDVAGQEKKQNQQLKRKRKALGETSGNSVAVAVVEKVAKRFGVVGLEAEDDGEDTDLQLWKKNDSSKQLLVQDGSSKAIQLYEPQSKAAALQFHRPPATVPTAISAAAPAALDRVIVRLEEGNSDPDPLPLEINLLFTGTDIFAGLRRLAELGSVDVDGMPGWMTGEECSSGIVVRGGLVVGGRGGGG